ncbi:MAG TPA: EutN/CcmL family microcompartment protein [Terriglobales bacterium]|nr:EutN/CcmL family microcompartment protein [Terriglobales bacterium]
MILGRVVGEIVATQKHPSHEGRKLLRIAPEAVEHEGAALAPSGMPPGALIALDSVDAGVGDRVLVVLDGFAAMSAVERPRSPIDAAVVGVVEQVDVGR